jgi:hypothetical protein
VLQGEGAAAARATAGRAAQGRRLAAARHRVRRLLPPACPTSAARAKWCAIMMSFVVCSGHASGI